MNVQNFVQRLLFSHRTPQKADENAACYHTQTRIHLIRLCRHSSLLPALSVLFSASASPFVAAQEKEFSIAASALAGASEWVCQAEVGRDRAWFMRCQQLMSKVANDPVLQDLNDEQQPTLIPLFGAPYADSDLPRLASAVLCNQEPSCNIVMAKPQ